MHNHQHPMNQFNIDGRVEYREPVIVESDMELKGNHIGSICVHRGGTFTIKPGTEHIGSLTFQSGSTGYIMGNHIGSLTLTTGASVEIIRGTQTGNVTIEDLCNLTVSPTGKVNGNIFQH